jgi:hypothetical protein
VRIRKHDDNRDFWDSVLIFVSKDENLTKAHVRYLEARLIELAKEARRATLENETAPIPGHLPEADQAEMEEFIEHLRMLASTLGVDVFEPVRQAALTISEPNVLKLHFRGRGYEARAVVREGRVVVSKDSFARKEEAPSRQESSRAVRAELLDSGVLRDEPKGLVFTQDYAFDSASGAAQAKRTRPADRVPPTRDGVDRLSYRRSHAPSRPLQVSTVPPSLCRGLGEAGLGVGGQWRRRRDVRRPEGSLRAGLEVVAVETPRDPDAARPQRPSPRAR